MPAEDDLEVTKPPSRELGKKDAAREPGKYHHDPAQGETSAPVDAGAQHGPHEPGERDPHEALNTPLDELDDEVVGRQRPTEGMGPRDEGKRYSPRGNPPTH
jgi:hypothetical protein